MRTKTTHAVVIEGMTACPASADGELRRLGLLPEHAGELAKTAEEGRAIDETCTALGALCRELGVGIPNLNPRAFHVFDDREFGARWGWGLRAFTQFGHVYLARRFLFLFFLQDLTHEIIHAAALRAAIVPSRGPESAVAYVRSGFSPLDGRADSKRWRLIGFNEGVTELIAMDLRRRMAGTAGLLLSEDMSRIFLGECLYPTFVRLVEGAIQATALPDADDAMRRALFIDYFARSSVFLGSLARKMPAALRILAGVETGREALVAAEQLGFDEAAASIKRHLMRRRKR